MRPDLAAPSATLQSLQSQAWSRDAVVVALRKHFTTQLDPALNLRRRINADNRSTLSLRGWRIGERAIRKLVSRLNVSSGQSGHHLLS